MEDKLVVRVPQRRFGTGEFTDDPNGPLNRGNRVGSGGALLSNLVQFMVGAPVVDYSSFAFSGSLGAFPGKVITIDTSLPSTGQLSPTAFTDATAYTHYTNNLMQNRGANASTATGTFTIVRFTTGNAYWVSSSSLGAVGGSNPTGLQTSIGGVGFVYPDIDTDLYDRDGNFVLTIRISSVANYSTDTPTGATWPFGISATFDVINPNYTDELNWSDMTSTNRGSGYSNPYTALHFDTKRNQNLSPTDPMSMYDIQGLAFAGLNIDAMVYPVANLSNGINLSRGGFNRPDLYSTSTNGIFTQFGAARAFGSVDPASQDDRSVDYFTIFRGPGYVRMLGQVFSDSYPPNRSTPIAYPRSQDLYAQWDPLYRNSIYKEGAQDYLNAPSWGTGGSSEGDIGVGDIILLNNLIRGSGYWPYVITAFIPPPASGPPFSGRFQITNLTENFDPIDDGLLAGTELRLFMRVIKGGGPDPAQSHKDTSYFFGKFNSYEEVSEYPHPMAFLGDIGYRTDGLDVANRTRPWWRSSYGSLDDADSDIWTEGFFNISAGYWILKAPSILSHDFVMGDSALNTPAQAKALLPSQNIGRWYVNGTGTTTISIGTVNDSKQMVATEFNGYFQAVAWDPVIGWQAPQGLFYQHLETPGAPRILPVTFRQIAPDDHSWTTSGANSQLITADYAAAAFNETYENIGEVPGMYWMNDIERYDGATPVPYAAGSQFNAKGRTLRMVIGYSQSAGTRSPVPASHGGNSGNLLFDMNEI